MAFTYEPARDVSKIILKHQTEMKEIRGTNMFGMGTIIDKIIREWEQCREGKTIPKSKKESNG